VREKSYGFGFSRDALAGIERERVFRGFGEVTVLHVKNIANVRYMFYMCF